MRKFLLIASLGLCFMTASFSQNVFNINDPIVRYNASQPLGSAQRPDPTRPGLQKWVSTPTNGISLGSGFDASSFKQYFINFNGAPLAFRIKYPRSFTNIDSAAKKYPIMVFLHGAGEVGCPTNNGVYNNEKQLWLGGGLFRDFVDQNKFDGFLVYPQLVNPDGCWGSWGSALSINYHAINNMIDSMAKYIRADIDRMVVNGLSGGGYGAWRFADAYPHRVAKIIPSAAAAGTANRNAYVHIPVWFATGGKDPDPNPAQSQHTYNRLKEIGSDIRFTLYPELGHSVWYTHWREPDYAAQLNDIHKANPLVFFQRNEFCTNEVINARLGLTPSFYAYEWQRDGITIATRTGITNTIILPEHVTSFTGNEIVVKSFGSYRARFKRFSTSEWTVFSPKPVVVKSKVLTQTPPITVFGAKSMVLPALDGNTTVPLQLPAGYIGYEWFRASDTTLVGSTQIFNAAVGSYIGRVSEQFGCGTSFSPVFKVVDAAGIPKPDPATNLRTTPLTQTTVRLQWAQANNETGFEIYRSLNSGGPYQFVSLRPANAVIHTDTGLVAGTTYYYVMRSVNNTGASATSNESSAKTLADVVVPTAPSNLQYRGSTPTSVVLKWTASTDNAPIKRYDIYANGIKMFSTNTTSFNVINLESNKSYSFVIKAVDNNGNESPPSNQVTGYTHQQGLNYKYYTTTANWSVLPNFNALTPAKTGVTDSVNINNTSIKTATLRYGFLWQGFIYIPVTASYTFETRSDDGSKLYIDIPYTSTAAAVVSNDSIHGLRTRTGVRTLTQGYHSIAVTFFQGISGSGLELWWSNNAGLVREKIPQNFFASQNGTLLAVPPVPATPTAVATGYNKIRLNWTDNSTTESGFEIVRALASTGPFVPVGTAPPNTNNYTDSGLTASRAYFYRLRAITPSSESGFTATVSATTPAAPLTPFAPSQLAATQVGSNAISLTWQDNSANETGFRVYRSTNGTTFALLATLGAATNSYTNTGLTPLVTYYYNVAGINASGEGARSNTVKMKAGNNSPVIGTLSAMYAKTGGTTSQDFSVTDDPADILKVVILNKPAFINITNTGGSNYRVTLNPTQDNVGWYNVTVSASDNHGKTTNSQFKITVADNNTRSVFVNFGATGKEAPAPWNNWTGNKATGNIILNLVDENNVPTSFSVTTTNTWSGTTILGHITGNNSGIVTDAVLESGIMDNAGPKSLRIGGLSAANRYNVELIGSQNEGLIATAKVYSGTDSAIMDARYNTTRSANLNGLTPDAAGNITVTIVRTGGSVFSYLNALIIEEYNPSLILNPEHLYAEPLDRNRISLTWSDRSKNETSYQVQRATDSLFTQNVTMISLPSNSTEHVDAGLIPNTKYWYRVRATDGTDFSGYSNKFTVITPASIVYIDFNSTLPGAAFPWNNTEESPLNEFIIYNLNNQSGVSSGMRLSVTKVFNGEFTAGLNTGNNSGVVPDNVLASNFWLDNTQLCQMKLSGLNHTRRYSVGFIGSSSTAGWFKGNYTGTYTVNGRTVYLNSWMNSSKVVYISDLIPNQDGELFLDFSTTLIAQWSFNAGIIVQEYNDATGGSILYMSNSTLDSANNVAVAPADDKYKVKVYPNPFSDIMNLDFYNPAAGNRISAEVYDLNGRLVHRQNYNNVPAGRNTLRVSPVQSSQNRGVFIVTLKVNGKVVQAVKMLRNK